MATLDHDRLAERFPHRRRATAGTSSAVDKLGTAMAEDLDRLAFPGVSRPGAFVMLKDECVGVLRELSDSTVPRPDLELFWRIRPVLPPEVWATAYDVVDGWLEDARRVLVEGHRHLDRRCTHPPVCGRRALPGSHRCRLHRLPALVRPTDVA